MRVLRLLLALALFAGCGALTPPRMDAGDDAGLDAGAADAGGADAGAGDAGADAGDTPDAGPCDGGFCAPELLTAERIDPWDLAVDGQHLYWLEYGLATNGLDGQVMKQRKDVVCLTRDAGCAVDLNTGVFGRFQVDTMTLTGDELCWTEHDANARDVICQGLLSNAERTLASNQPGATEPVAVGGELWWVNRGSSLAAQDGQVMKLSLTAPPGTPPRAMVSSRPAPGSVAVGPGHFAWTEAGSSVDAGAVWAAPLDGGAPFAIAAGQRTPLSVVRCGPDGELFWVNYRDNTVMKGAFAPSSGTVLVSNQKSPFQVVCDEDTLYWLNAGVSANGADGELWQARLDGGEAAVMVRGIPLAWALAVDDVYVYYLAQGTVTRLDGRLYRVRKHR
ncbi:MAG: hypothetical protein AB1938_26020 [Myxococcota bacterium]